MKKVHKLLNLLPAVIMIAGGLSLVSLLLTQGRGASTTMRVPVAENMAASA